MKTKPALRLTKRAALLVLLSTLIPQLSTFAQGPILDKVNGYPAFLMGAARQTGDRGGHTGAAGDLALDTGTGTGAGYVPDASFINAAAADDTLTVAFFQNLRAVRDSSAFWVNSPGTIGTRGIQAHTPWSDNDIYFDTSGCCTLDIQRINLGIGSFPDYTGDATWWQVWHHFAFVKDGTAKRIYIDGKLFHQGLGDPLKTDFTTLIMGGGPSITENRMDGFLDDFVVYNGALTEAQALALSGGASPSSVPGLIAHWDFNLRAGDVTQPGDSIELVNGANDGDANAGPPPAGEGVEHAIDNAGQKYLNFLDQGSGLAVEPRVGLTLITGLRLYTANDVEARDPASYLLEGSTVGLAGPWTTLSSGPLALPAGRNDGGSTPLGQNFQELIFSNSFFHAAYRLTFPTLKDAAAAIGMQIGEVELLGVPKPSAPQRLTVRKVEPGLITINWGDSGTLEEALSVTGSFSDVAGATAPYTTTHSAQMKFFRLRMAQGYSPNAVAYVNLSLYPGVNLIQNPLDATVAGGNTVSNVLAGVPDGTTVYQWTPGTGFTVNDYTSLFGWTDPQMTLAPGEGVFLYLPGTSVFTLLFVGEVMQGALATALVHGFNLVGSQVPQAGTLTANLGFTPAAADLVFQYKPSAGYTVYTRDDFEWLPLEPNIAVAEGFWLRKIAAGTWTRTFSINP